MTKKKSTAKDGHVTLSKETISKLLQRGESMGQDADPEHNPRSVHLDTWDMLALERSELALQKAVAAAEQAKLKAINTDLQLRLAALGAQTLATEHARGLTEANLSHRKLVDGVAAKYGFDWATHSYNSETGEVTEF